MSEGKLHFEFRTAITVDQPEVQAQPFKCVDFVAEDLQATWMIEVSDATRVQESERGPAVRALLGQLRSTVFKKDMLMKLYGTHAHFADFGKEPNSKVLFCVIIGLPTNLIDSAQRNRMRDEMARITNRIGPSFHGTSNRPIIRVETIESWNASQSDVLIT